MTDLLERIRVALQDRYHFHGELGQGSAAVVYLAEDLRHHRQVAIKVLRPEVAADAGADRFIREIETVAQLSHPHILPLFDSGETGGLPWFVMPYMPGESLRQRLAHEHQLQVDEALDIVRDVAGALGYAHSLGIVHRDIKPGNILFWGGRAIVSDFGVARAISAAANDDEAERPGELFGTPLYMSPEQFTGSARVDRRSDLYSLGCVLYEMIAGVPPFTGPTAELLRLQHVTQPAPSLRDSQRKVSPELVEVVDRLLAKQPADRFVTAQQLVDGLPSPMHRPTPRVLVGPRPARRIVKRRALAGGALAAAVLAGVVWAGTRDPAPIANRFAVMTTGSLAGQDSRYVAALAGELQRFAPATVVEGYEILEAVNRYGVPSDAGSLRRIARRVRADRLVRLDRGAAGGDSLAFSVTVYPLAGGDAVAPAVEMVHCSAVRAGECEAALGEAMRRQLVRETGYHDGRPPGTGSLSAYLNFASGMMAYGEWNLARADSLLGAAVDEDPSFARARLNLAEVRMWAGRPDDAWRQHAAEAARLSDELGPREGSRARALVALADGRNPDACQEFDALIARDSADFSAWYGRGECLQRDRIVVRDPHSRSGWRFRSSVEAAIRSFEHALEIAPVAHRAFGERAYDRVRKLFYVDEYQARGGYLERGAGGVDSLAFAAWPDLERDTLLFRPWPFQEAMRFEPWTRAPNQWRALLRNRSRLAGMTENWVRKFPESASAHLARAEALESLREGGLETGWAEVINYAATAQRLASTPGLAATAAMTRLRLLLKGGDFEAVAKLADSLLAAVQSRDTAVVRQLASVAALTGHVARAVHLSSIGTLDYRRLSSDGRTFVLPGPPSASAFALLTYAAFGMVDSVRVLERRLDEMLPGYVGTGDLPVVRTMVFERPATLAWSARGLGPGHTMAEPRSLMAQIQLAQSRGNTIGRDAGLSRIAEADAWWRPSSASIDGELTLAQLRLRLGDTATVVRRTSQVLASFAAYGSDLLGTDIEGSLPQMAALPQLMALRAELARRDADMETARRWARVVTQLWRTADPELQPMVERMRTFLTADSTGTDPLAPR